MNTKFSEKQTNILYASVAGMLLLLFGFLIYSDYETLEDVKQKLDAKLSDIKLLEQKKKEIPDLKADLWGLQQKYRYFQNMLPNKQESVNFYAKLDKFRLEKGIKPWKSFRSKEVMIETPEIEADPRSMKSKLAAPKPIQKPANASIPYVETQYMASVTLNFDQLVQLLNMIENDERFYGIQEIRIGSVQENKDGAPNPEMNVELTLVSFTYIGDLPLDQEVARYLDDKYEPSAEAKEKLDVETKQWSSRDIYFITRNRRNPFDKEQVLRRALRAIDDAIREEKIPPPPLQEQLRVEIEKLQNIRNFLHQLAVAESWVDLQNALIKNEYEKQLMSLQITKGNDPQNVFGEKVSQMKKELKDWKEAINAAKEQDKAEQLVVLGKKKIKEMEDLYQQGKEKGSQELFEKILAIHNELMPQFRDFINLESKIPELETIRKQLEIMYSKAETQIKIIQMASKLKLQGIIYMAEKPELSIAFINKQLVKRNDIVMMGFVVHDIQEQGVVLRYKEETVPIRFKRLTDKPKEAKPEVKDTKKPVEN